MRVSKDKKKVDESSVLTQRENSLKYFRENNRKPCEKIKFYFNTAKPVSVPVRFCKRNWRKDDCTIKLRI